MSSIEKLSIQGIRSFGPNADDMQSLTFVSPLTLIVGENGCGKTTIIECLKYALTGEAPPGSDRGKNFIHDPKIFNRGDALGQIKLQVSNIRGEHLSVCRSMKISMKRGKPTFETLDSTINSLDGGKNSKGESISKRCADADVSMCEFMGVSKAIITNVLFCHQEDASWPLEEPKKLKEKFDAIFGTTEYNKAIDDIIKLRKTQMEEVKVNESNLRYLAHLKQEMENKALALEAAKKKHDNIQEQIKNFETGMQPITTRLAQIRDIELDIGKHQARKVEMETRLKNCNNQIENLRKKIKTPFNGDLAALELELEEFDNKMCIKQVEQEEKMEHLNFLRVQEKDIQKSLAALDKNCFELRQQAIQERECETKRAENIQKLCAQLQRPCKSPLNAENVLLALTDISSGLKSEQQSLNDKTAETDADDQQRQQQIDNLRVELTKLEQQVTALLEQQKNQQQEIAQLEQKMREVERATRRLTQLNTDIQVITEAYENLEKKNDRANMRSLIETRKKHVQTLQQQFQRLDQRLTRLSVISKQLVEVSLKEQELQKRVLETRRLKARHSDNLRKLLDRNVEQDFKRNVQRAQEELKQELDSLTAQVNKEKQQEHVLQISRKNIKAEIQRMQQEQEDCKEKIKSMCRSNRPYEELLLESKLAVDRCQLDYGAKRSAEALYKKYLQKIEEDPLCPLCHKDMSNNEVSDLSDELKYEIQQLPENIKRAAASLKAAEKKYELLLKLQPVIERSKLLTENIPKSKAELEKIEEDCDKSVTAIEALQSRMTEPNMKLTLASGMLGDMSLLDESIKETTRLQQDLARLKQQLPEDHDDSVTLEDLQLEKATVSTELEQVRKSAEKMQQDYEKYNEELQGLREQKNKLKDEQIKLQEGVQNLPQLKERHELLSKQFAEGKEALQQARAKVQPLKQQLNAAVAEKSRQRENNRKLLAQMQKTLESHRNMEHDILRLHKEVLEYQKLNLPQQLKTVNEKIDNKKKELEHKTENIADCMMKLDVLKKDCINHEIMERDLKDNRELKLLQQEYENIKNQCAELEQQLSGLDFRRISREKSDLMRQHDEATAERGKLLGQIGEIKNQIEKIETEVNQPQYKDSASNYRRALYEVAVTRAIITDLGQYRLGLEWALMQFHKEKMDKINRLIREYWRLIYRGNDIDYIQIQTDENEQSNAATAADRRRSYNYRVVQSKNDTIIEMRGRCSAGQRVLASLIIRMALAETFSSNCGVLALDEPTTNLDRMNIISLCDALNRIIDDRQTQCNFMLIVITHDEEFISMLGKVDSYYRVFRSEQCKSVIRLVQNY